MLVLVATAQVQAATYFFHNHHQGAPQAVTDESQETVWKVEYEPFWGSD